MDEDLIALVDSGYLAGATLDVCSEPSLCRLSMPFGSTLIVVTPLHVGTHIAIEESIAQIASKIIAHEPGAKRYRAWSIVRRGTECADGPDGGGGGWRCIAGIRANAGRPCKRASPQGRGSPCSNPRWRHGSGLCHLAPTRPPASFCLFRAVAEAMAP